MKSKIRKILLDNLKSAHDGGNIDDGSIMGGDKTIDQLYDLFVDEMTAIKGESPVEEPKDRFSRFANTSLFPEKEKNEHMQNMIESGDWFLKPDQPKKKVAEILYTNPKTGKTQKLFDELLPVYTVRCSEAITIGDRGCSVSMNVAAKNKEEAMDNAMKNKEFTKYIRMKDFDRKYLSVYNPIGNYVIGKVEYYEGDERL